MSEVDIIVVETNEERRAAIIRGLTEFEALLEQHGMFLEMLAVLPDTSCLPIASVLPYGWSAVIVATLKDKEYDKEEREVGAEG